MGGERVGRGGSGIHRSTIVNRFAASSQRPPPRKRHPHLPDSPPRARADQVKGRPQPGRLVSPSVRELLGRGPSARKREAVPFDFPLSKAPSRVPKASFEDPRGAPCLEFPPAQDVALSTGFTTADTPFLSLRLQAEGSPFPPTPSSTPGNNAAAFASGPGMVVSEARRVGVRKRGARRDHQPGRQPLGTITREGGTATKPPNWFP